MSTDGSTYEKDHAGIQFVKHFESFLGATSMTASMEESDVCLFNKIDATDAMDMCKRGQYGRDQEGLV
ncbi:hypothetical protein Tco_0563099 [Tanacetum coccineum]